MKKWAKVLTWIGIIWVVLILALCIFLYFQVKQYSNVMADASAMGNLQSILVLIDASSPFSSLFAYFLELGIPAWILFIIAGIFGREKMAQQNERTD